MNIKELLNKFKEQMILDGLAKKTIKSYISCINLLTDKMDFNNLSQEDVNQFFINLENPLNTINQYKKALIKWVRIFELDIKIPKFKQAERKIPNYFSEDFFLSEIIPSVDMLFKDDIKVRCLFYLMFYTGLRVGEIANLKKQDFDLKNKRINIQKRKAKNPIVVFYPNQMADLIQLYFDNTAGEDVFGFTDGTVRYYCKILSENLNKHIHPHTFRHCVSEDTEILTENGWKKYNELEIEEKVFSYNLNTKKIEIDNIQRINVYTYNGNLNHIKNNSLDYILTSNHNIIINVDKGKMIRNKTYDNFVGWKSMKFEKWLTFSPNRRSWHLLSGKTKGHLSIGKQKASLLGWIMTDGHISQQKDVTISQSLSANKSKCKIIEKTLIKSGLKFTKHIQKQKINIFNGNLYQMVIFRILKKDTKWIYDWINENNSPKYKILKLKQTELKEVYNSMMLGDGSKKEFCDQDIKKLNFFQALCLCIGYRATIKINGGKFRTYISNRDYCCLYKRNISKIKYKGVIWCPTTKTGTWIAKRNGKAFITGNSFSIAYLKKGGKGKNLQSLLGHKSRSATLIYEEMSDTDREEEFRKIMKIKRRPKK